MPSIDVHCHTLPPPLISELKQVAKGNTPQAKSASIYLQRPETATDPQFAGALDERIGIMDGAGVDVEIISTPLPLGTYFADLSQRGAVAQGINDVYTGASQRHPTRYHFFATLPLPDVPASIKEFLRVSKLPGFAGVILPTNFGIPFNDHALEDLYAEMAKAKSLLFVHPCRMEHLGRYANMGMETMVGWPSEDTLAVMELVLGGVLERHRELTVIAPHVGGTVLYLVGRIDHTYNHWPASQKKIPNPPTVYLKRMYYDSVCDSHPTLNLARSVVGADHLVLGSDFPFWYRDQMGQCLQVINTLDWSKEELDLVRGVNMVRLLQGQGRW